MATVSNMILNNNKSKLIPFGTCIDPPLGVSLFCVSVERKEKQKEP